MTIIEYNQQETSNLYLGALMVITIQCIMVSLIIMMMVGDNKFKIQKAESFFIIIPRFLSSIMMHLNVEPDIRNGLNLMKWAINHPGKFKSTEKHSKHAPPVRKVFYAFLLGFF